jgi:hypothetical protein
LVLHLECQGNQEITLVSEKLRVSSESSFTESLAGLVGAENISLSAKSL